ncbi:MAG TPA: hypothetical protein ENK62_04135 [Chromatiales bacterium]|nr:hypothetical protein [Chromatiales bacterium]
MDGLIGWAQSADPVLFGITVAVLLGAAALAGYLTFTRWQRLRLIEDVPTSKIRSAAQGYVELIGTARMLPGAPVVAPFTGVHCVWYRYKVDKRVSSSGQTPGHWRTVRSGVSGETFGLEDGTGRCVIDPEGAEVYPSVTQVWEDSAPLAVLSAGSILGSLGSGRYRYTEQRIHDGEPLYAIGELRTLSGADQGTAKEDLLALLRQWKRSPEHFLKPFDANGNGQIDAEEWEAVRKAAQAQVMRERAERAREQAAVHLLARPRTERLPFILATRSQAGLLRRLRWTVAGLATLGTAAAGPALFLLWARG